MHGVVGHEATFGKRALASEGGMERVMGIEPKLS
jgi:hypothetical protein